MTSSARKIHALVAILAACITACGPTKPPSEALGNATRTLATARTSGAATYAPLELRSAESKLAAANTASAREDYDQAAVLASESAVDSELAVAKARLGKAREAAEKLKQQNAQLSRDSAPHADGAGSP
jgi:Domain of unknown function (DUF4398)